MINRYLQKLKVFPLKTLTLLLSILLLLVNVFYLGIHTAHKYQKRYPIMKFYAGIEIWEEKSLYSVQMHTNLLILHIVLN